MDTRRQKNAGLKMENLLSTSDLQVRKSDQIANVSRNVERLYEVRRQRRASLYVAYMQLDLSCAVDMNSIRSSQRLSAAEHPSRLKGDR